MKVEKYIERCKSEIGWDSDAEQEWKQILKNQEKLENIEKMIPNMAQVSWVTKELKKILKE